MRFCHKRNPAEPVNCAPINKRNPAEPVNCAPINKRNPAEPVNCAPGAIRSQSVQVGFIWPPSWSAPTIT